MRSSSAVLLTLTYIFGASIGCGESELSAGADVTEGVSRPSETRAQAPAMTLWMTTLAQPGTEPGSVQLRLSGRASKNLTAVTSYTQEAGPHGTVRLLSARRFEVVLGNLGEIDHVLAGRPLYLDLESSVGQQRHYQARIELRLDLTEFSGDRQIWIGSRITPTYVPADKDNLRYRGWFSLPRSADASEVRVEHAGFSVSELGSLDNRRWSFDLRTPMLASLLGTPISPLSVHAALGGAPLLKSARPEVRVSTLALTPREQPFASETCESAVADCLADGSQDPSGCGSYQQIRLCLPSAPTSSCEPNLEWAMSDCVDRVIQDFATDPDRGWLSSLEALEYCTNEGDLTGPIFDEICGYAPDTAFCGCAGEETCFERFHNDYVAPCGLALRSRFDCALGRNTRDLKVPGPRAFVLDRKVLFASDVTDSLLAEQIVIAVRQSAHEDVQDVADAFTRVDGGEINQIEFWEGTSSRAVTVIEYGAGDNSYGAVFAHGSTTMVTRIQDGDFYKPNENFELGCDIPYGAGWSRCESNESCAAGFSCQGAVSSYDDTTGEWLGFIAAGKCAAPSAPSPRDGDRCSALDPCPLEAGLWCSTIASGGEGSCRPMWMFGHFDVTTQLTIPTNGTTSQPFMVYGLATVPEEAYFEASINFGDFTKLKLALANPIYGTTSVFFDGPALGRAGVEALLGTASGEVRVKLPVWVPGDESVNGEWQLLVDTTGPGSGLSWRYATNVIYGEPRVSFSSRWD